MRDKIREIHHRVVSGMRIRVVSGIRIRVVSGIRIIHRDIHQQIKQPDKAGKFQRYFVTGFGIKTVIF
jgi:hypothetical protein